MPRRTGGFIGHRGLQAPDPPIDVTPTAGNAQVSVAFTAPSDVGDDAITGFVAQVSTDGTNYSAGSNTGSSSPIVVSSLTNGTAATAKVWAINDYGTSAPSEASASFSPVAPNVGLIAGGFTGSAGSNEIQQINILSSGNATDFGDLTVGRYLGAGVSSSTRAVFAGGNDRSADNKSNFMDYVTIASAGNATDFGDCYAEVTQVTGCSNGTVGLIIGGTTSLGGTGSNMIQKITIASTGNASDEADSLAAAYAQGACGNTTYGVYGGGSNSSNTRVNQIGRFAWSSLGSQTDFGDLSVSRQGPGGASSSTRAVFCAGLGDGFASNTIDYITIASTGNASDFGDSIQTNQCANGMSNKTTAVFIFGSGQALDAITIASTGNASDFGDISSYNSGMPMTASDSHGGIA